MEVQRLWPPFIGGRRLCDQVGRSMLPCPPPAVALPACRWQHVAVDESCLLLSLVLMFPWMLSELKGSTFKIYLAGVILDERTSAEVQQRSSRCSHLSVSVVFTVPAFQV